MLVMVPSIHADVISAYVIHLIRDWGLGSASETREIFDREVSIPWRTRGVAGKREIPARVVPTLLTHTSLSLLQSFTQLLSCLPPHGLPHFLLTSSSESFCEIPPKPLPARSLCICRTTEQMLAATRLLPH